MSQEIVFCQKTIYSTNSEAPPPPVVLDQNFFLVPDLFLIKSFLSLNHFGLNISFFQQSFCRPDLFFSKICFRPISVVGPNYFNLHFIRTFNICLCTFLFWPIFVNPMFFYQLFLTLFRAWGGKNTKAPLFHQITVGKQQQMTTHTDP